MALLYVDHPVAKSAVQSFDDRARLRAHHRTSDLWSILAVVSVSIPIAMYLALGAVAPGRKRRSVAGQLTPTWLTPTEPRSRRPAGRQFPVTPTERCVRLRRAR
ncbi:MAG: hypothetical protein ACKOXM_03675 [Agromyces sp.]